jgi:DNA-binding transcriptional regulator YdaS (Cro superfamily)
MKTTLALTDAQMIGILGGAKTVANLFKIDQAAVNQWKVNGIPLNRLVFLAAEIEKKSNGLVTRKDMFPKLVLYVWPELLPKTNAFGTQNETE